MNLARRTRAYPQKTAETRQRPAFEPYKGKIRKAGTGCVTRVNDHLWEGKFSPKWPDGKTHSRNIYAKTEQECEEKLAELIRQMRAEIAEAKRLVAEGKPCEAMMLARNLPIRPYPTVYRWNVLLQAWVVPLPSVCLTFCDLLRMSHFTEDTAIFAAYGRIEKGKHW